MSYDDANEEQSRLRAFDESLGMIAAHNGQGDSALGRPRAEYALGLNRFADMAWCVV